MRKFILLLAVWSTGQCLHAQQKLADSMAVLLQRNLPDSERANTMLMQAMYMEEVDTSRAHQLYRDTRAFAGVKKLDYFIAKSWQFEAFLFGINGRSEEAIEFAKNALPLVENRDEKKFRQLYLKTLANIANYYLDIGDVKNALSYHLKNISIAEKAGTVRVADYTNIANVYHRMEEPDEERTYTYKALALAKSHQSETEIFQCYYFLSLYYTSIKDYTQAKAYSDSGRLFHYRSFDAIKQATNPDMAYNTYQGYYLTVATAFANNEIFDSARIYYDSAYQMAKAHHVDKDLMEPQIRLGYIFFKQKDYPNAEKILLEAAANAKQHANLKGIANSADLLNQVYYAMGAYQKAYDQYKVFYAAKDSISGIDKRKFATELEVKYETEKKEQQLKLQASTIKEERLLKSILFGSLLALALIAFVGFRSYQNRQKLLVKEKELQQQQILQLESEKQLAATQAVFRGQEEERSRLAKDLHDGLGGILSSAKYSFNSMKQQFVLSEENALAFEKSMRMLDESISELRRVAHNMMPETLMKLSLNEALQDYCQQITQSGVLRISYQSFGMDELKVDNSIKTTVYRIVQELINNIIKHAAASNVIVQLISKENMLNITVEDDGKGFDTTLLERAEGIGYKNIKSRIAFLKGSLDVQSRKDEGSSVYIEIPLQS